MASKAVRSFGGVDFYVVDEIAVLRIDNPPVNAVSLSVRQGLVSGLAEAKNMSAKGVVILGAGRCFVAGSDLREFGQKLQTPELPDVIRAIETALFPVVAAIHGVALGGGLELALGCDYRVAAAGTQLGLPEVSLGFIPGAGGTQRLPRLIGISKAISLICGASRISAQEGLALGMIDALATNDLLKSALTFLSTKPRRKRLIGDLKPPSDEPSQIDAAASQALKRSNGQANVAEAIRLVRAAAHGELENALADERAVFQRLRLSDEAFALRYLFFAERRAGTIDGLNLKNVTNPSIAGVIGGGTMGQGIVRAMLAAGFSVVLVEHNDAILTKAMNNIGATIQSKIDRGRLSHKEAQEWLGRLEGATDLAAVSKSDLVIEAVYEDMDVKKSLLQELGAILASDAVIATNTSYLDINEMSAALAHPDRVIGLHFFSPADVMKLLEIVRAGKTSDLTLAKGFKLARSLGKQPVVASVAEGFIGNRIYAAYRRRAELLVLDGANPQEVDRAATDFGFAMGPFAVADLSGLDIAWAMRKRQAAKRDPRARYVTIADTLCELQRLGRKSGKGWYDYTSGQGQADPEVDAIIELARKQANVKRQKFTPDTIQRQLLAAIINEAACVLEEGVAQRPSDIDVVLANGYGFPRWRGGPLYWASKQDRDRLMADLASLEQAIGHGFIPGPVANTLTQLNAEREG